MKKKILLFLLLLAGMGSTHAANTLTVETVHVPQNGTGIINVVLDNDDELTAFEMRLVLPTGFSAVAFENGDRMADDQVVQTSEGSGYYTIISNSATSQPFAGNTGTLLSIEIRPGSTLPVGTTLAGMLQKNADEISGIEFIKPDGSQIFLGEVEFNIVIDEPLDTRIVLDENDTTHPENANGVDVRVIRPLKANVWNTLVLPFDMTNSQLQVAFGTEVRVAKFSGWETLEYDGDDATSISVTFTDIDHIVNNQPVIIKVQEAIDEFTVDGVNLVFEEDPMTAVGRIRDGNRGTFIGTYVPMILDDPEYLFISNNKFYYSSGSSSMKGYRGYFWFQDKIANPNVGDARFNIVVGDDSETTGIAETSDYVNSRVADDEVYNMQGVRVVTPAKGLYIKNGKKVVIK